MHHMRKGVERLCRSSRRARVNLSRNQQFAAASTSNKSGGGAGNDGSKTGQTVHKSAGKVT